MPNVQDIKEHSTVLGSDGQHVGTVDHLDGDRIKLTKNDSPDGAHHYIAITTVASADAKGVKLNVTAAQAKASWKSE